MASYKVNQRARELSIAVLRYLSNLRGMAMGVINGIQLKAKSNGSITR